MVYLFSPPTTAPEDSNVDARQARWETRNLHHLPWTLPGKAYTSFKTILTSLEDNCELFTKGTQKVAFLEQLIGRKVHDLAHLAKVEDINKFQTFGCLYHKTFNIHCAPYKLLDYLLQMDLISKNNLNINLVYKL